MRNSLIWLWLLVCASGLSAQTPRVTREQLKQAVIQKNWDLLDRLLEVDSSAINDNSLFQDSWGEWSGLLIQCVTKSQVDGVRILLKHGANPQLATWGEGEHTFPLAVAEKRKNELIYRLLCGLDKPVYQRSSDPPLPGTP